MFNPIVVETAELASEAYLVSVKGELDLYTVPALKAELARQEPKAHVVVDLTRVTFVDSTGLGALVQEERRLRDGGGELSLVCDESEVLRLLTITGLIHIFRVHPTLEAAAEAVLGPAD